MNQAGWPLLSARGGVRIPRSSQEAKLIRSRALRDELSGALQAREEAEELARSLRHELDSKSRELKQLQSQLARAHEDASDSQVQRDQALSELKAANQVAEAGVSGDRA